MKRPSLTPREQSRHLQHTLPRLVATAGQLVEDVAAVMATMERGYAAVAQQYGFVCQGCEESCCRTVFYHHTYAEFLLLSEGVAALPPEEQFSVGDRSQEVQAVLAGKPLGTAAVPPRAMCPLNVDGRCRVYQHRPMVCRLHGIPHLLRRLDGHIIEGPGCHRFEAVAGITPSQRLDRTPYYQQLAQVEQALRRHLESPIRLHMTLAEWLHEWIDTTQGGERPGAFTAQC
ncbi:MAG: hypothetical protein QNJ22_16935 [Desulfosarcinaceae bacterium]|nr:hypothetical protein [Desulfosarcinaceae bacterium]